MGNAEGAKASMLQKCAAFLMRKMRHASQEVAHAAGPVVAEAYFEGAEDAARAVLDSCNHARTLNPDCAFCPGLRCAQDTASDIVAQCHGAKADQARS